MSKAFVREDAESDGEDDAEKPRRRGASYITPEGASKMQDEIDFLWKVERRRITKEVEAAAAQGDRSDNAEYRYGKKRLREIDRRLQFLQKRLDTLTIVVPSPEQEGKVFFGAWVTVEDEDDKAQTYRIVGPDEIDLDKRWISIDSPIARALLGKKVGDDVTVRRPKGEAELVVVSIRYSAG